MKYISGFSQDLLRARLNKIIDEAEIEEKANWLEAQDAEAHVHSNLIGFASGIRHVISLIRSEFKEVYHPTNQVVFEEQGKWYFLDEIWEQIGPYGSELEAHWEMWRHAHVLDTGKVIASYEHIAPVLDKLIGSEEVK